MRGGMLAGCTHNRPATRNGRLESASKRASTNNEDRTMNSGGELCQSGSRTAKTVTTHCNVQTAPRSAQAVHFGLLQSSRTCPVSATRSPQHDGPGCTAPSVVRTTTQRMHPPTRGSRRCTEARLPTQGTAHQAAPFAQPSHNRLHEEPAQPDSSQVHGNTQHATHHPPASVSFWAPKRQASVLYSTASD